MKGVSQSTEGLTRTCAERVTVWKGSGSGEVCVCGMDYRHVFDDDPVKRWHTCYCRLHTMWMDDQQIAEIKASGGAR